MQISDLADMVPELMAEHPTHTWVRTSSKNYPADLVLEISPNLEPERKARVQVTTSLEVYFMDFAGHGVTDFAYEDEDRREVMEGQIDLAARVTLGPTRVTLERAGDVLVRSALIVDPDGPGREEFVTSYTPGYLTARLFRREVLREVLEFRALHP